MFWVWLVYGVFFGNSWTTRGISLLEAIFRAVIPFFFSWQCYLFVYYTGWRNAKSFLTFGLICLCNMYLYELRNLWQLFFHVTVGAFSTLQIRLRRPQGKSPDYNVWQVLEHLEAVLFQQIFTLRNVKLFSKRSSCLDGAFWFCSFLFLIKQCKMPADVFHLLVKNFSFKGTAEDRDEYRTRGEKWVISCSKICWWVTHLGEFRGMKKALLDSM